MINALKKRPREIKAKRIEMLGSTTAKVGIYQANIKAIDGQFTMDIELTKVHKLQLTLGNHEALLSKYNHLKGVKIDDRDNKLHVVLGVNEYAV